MGGYPSEKELTMPAPSDEPMLAAALAYEAQLRALIKDNDKAYGVGRRPKNAYCRDGSSIRSRRWKETKE
jgi:hypothetical protein